MSDAPQGLPEVCGALASTLADEVVASGVEQVKILMIGRASGQKMLVLVATTDTSVDAVLEFLDAQVESGTVVIQERHVVETGIKDGHL